MMLEDKITSAIRSRADEVRPWVPDLDSIRRGARSQARRQVAAVVSGVAAAAIVAVAAAGLGGGTDRSTPPADRPVLDPPDGGVVRVDDNGVVRIPQVRDEQVVVTPRVESAVSPGPRVVESASSDDASYDGSGELSVRLEGGTDYSSFVATCTGAPEAFLVVTIEPNEAYLDWGRCDGSDVSLAGMGAEPQDQTLNVFVTEEDPRDARRCWLIGTAEGCDELVPPATTGSGASFGVEVHREHTGPVAVRMFGEDVYARQQWDGALYSLTTAAAGATGASELSVRVAGSDVERIAWATIGSTQALQRCMEETESDECLPTIQVSLDGQPFEEPDVWPYGMHRGWGSLGPGKDHVLTMRVVEGDPRNVDLGFWVYAED